MAFVNVKAKYIFLIALFIGNCAYTATIRVPTDQSTIQLGISVAQFGDTVLVSPGHYFEHINLIGKSIFLISEQGPDSTIIDKVVGGVAIITCGSGENPTIRGFTIRGSVDRAGIVCQNGATPLITQNIIRDITTWGDDGGIQCTSPKVRIIDNTFINIQSGGKGGAIYVGANGVVIDSNEITQCSSSDGGGAICFMSTDSIQITNNLIWNNTNTDDWGGVLYSEGSTNPLIAGNTIVKNITSTTNGSGITLLNVTRPRIQRNIIAFNRAGFGIYAFGTSNETITCNDVFGNTQGSYFGVIGGATNLSVDPMFCDTSSADFSISGLSQCAPSNNACSILIGAIQPLCCVDTFDLDSDGYVDYCGDNCPTFANPGQEDVDLDQIGDVCDSCTDTDQDGFGNPGFSTNTCQLDNCPNLSNPAQVDIDNDGVGDVCDNCPIDFNPAQSDADEDGIGNICDVCSFDPQNDIDQDGICGDVDNCPFTNNTNQEDLDNDGIGDACDICPFAFNPAQGDSDNDTYGDSCDNCPSVFNSSQLDSDNDGIGNACDLCQFDTLNDVDSDSICGGIDNCPVEYNPNQLDSDSDGKGDVCDNCPFVANQNQADADSNGIGDACCCIGNRGDVNLDGTDANILDLNYLVNRIFRGGQNAGCPNEADINSDGTASNILDLNFLVNRIFRGGPAPTACS